MDVLRAITSKMAVVTGRATTPRPDSECHETNQTVVINGHGECPAPGTNGDMTVPASGNIESSASSAPGGWPDEPKTTAPPEPEEQQEEPQQLPDYVLDPTAVLQDATAEWRYGRRPDYSNTRQVYESTKRMSHTAGTLPSIVENIVKNWEIEASFKTSLDDWRTIDHSNYSFSTNGLPPQTGEHMLKVGTYNALLTSNEYYCPKHSDFASSHKTFKRMMPTFAWEVLEVYSGPPRVAFRWRHWGTMKNDYVGFNDKGEKVVAKAHGGQIELEGVTIAEVNDKLQIGKLETWYDPMTMFRQIAPQGIINKVPMPIRDPPEDAAASEGEAEEGIEEPAVIVGRETVSVIQEATMHAGQESHTALQEQAAVAHPGKAQATHPVISESSPVPAPSAEPAPTTMEAAVGPEPGEAVATGGYTEEAKITHEEMSTITVADCPVFMNKE